MLDIHDGELMPTLENRRTMIRLIRQWKADIVMGHRPNDYHPDHRYTGVLMQDSAFIVTVPFFCPDTPHLTRNPVFLYVEDPFRRPNPFRADVVVAIDGMIEKKLKAIRALESQLIEGGCGGNASMIAKNAAEKEVLCRRCDQRFQRWATRIANQYRDKLIELYGEEKGKQVKYAEAFEVCEYGRRPTREELLKLFPFFPKKK